LEAATVLEITPETLRARAQAARDEAERLRERQVRLRADAYRLDKEAEALEEAERVRSAMLPEPSARAILAGEIAAYLARCRQPKSSTEIADRFDVTAGRTRASLELLVEIGMVYRSGLKRGTRYRILRDGEAPPDEPRPFGDRWHEHVRDVAIRLGTFTRAEIVAEIPEVADTTVYRWLSRLVEDGILSVERVGVTNVYAYERPETPDVMAVAEVKAPRQHSGARAVPGTGKSKASRREVADIIRVAKAGGAEIRPAKHGYLVSVDGEVVGSVPRTPSDHRSLRNAKASLRRNGGA
jgi:FaeA-like protein